MSFSGIVISLLILCTGITGENIYISKSTKSRDSITCGSSIQQPCKTLRYASWKASSGDTIVIRCPKKDGGCKIRLDDNIRVISKEISIRGADDNLVSPTLFLKKVQLFRLSGSNTKLTISNLTVNLRWSLGTVLNRQSEINLEHCTIIMKKEKYHEGIGNDLIFMRVRRFAALKMNVTNCKFLHPQFDQYRVLNLILTDEVGVSVDVSIQKTTFNGNMAVYLKASGRGLLHIHQIYLNYTSVFVEGYTRKRTWESIKIIQAEFNKGLFQQQLSLTKLKTVIMEKVSFNNNAGNGLRSQNVNKLIMKDCYLKTRSNNILSSKEILVQETRLETTSLVIQMVDNVTIQQIQTQNSIIINNWIQRLSEDNGEYKNSNFEMFNVKHFMLANSKYSTIKFSSNPLKVTESIGTLTKCKIKGGALQTHNSRLWISASMFDSTTAFDGGAIFNKNSSLDIIETVFTNCSAKYHGGSIYSVGEGRISLNNVSFQSYISESKQPTSFGTVIHSVSPIIFTDIKIRMEDSTSSPLIYVKPAKEISNCYDSLVISGGFEVLCPQDRKVENEQRVDDMNDFCSGKSLRFLSVSCVKCMQGYSNPYRPTLDIDEHNHTFTKKNNTCFSCTKLQDEGKEETHTKRCATMECVNNHVIKTTQINCPDGYSLNIFSNECVNWRGSNRNSVYIFWGVLMVISFLYAIILMYIKELVVILNLKRLYLQLKCAFEKCCRCCSFGKQDDSEIDEHFIFDDVRTDEFDFVFVQQKQVLITPLRFTIGTTMGIIKIIFFFYQVETLIRVQNPYKKELEIFVLSIIRDTLSTVFSLRLSYDVNGLFVIPILKMTQADKEILRALYSLLLLTPIILITVTFILRSYCCSPKQDEDPVQNNDPPERNNNTYEDIIRAQQPLMKTDTPPKLKVSPMKDRFKRVDGKVPIFVEVPLHYRVKCFLLLFITLAYFPISTLILRSISCTEVDNKQSWSIQQNIQCYQIWQYICMALAAVWVVPFPAAVYFASRMQYTCKICPREFFLCLLFPPSLLVFYARNRITQYRRTISKANAMLAKHLLMVLYEPFRLQKVDKRFDVMWDSVYLTRKLVLMVLTIFAPVSMNLYLVLVFLIISLVQHVKVKPFNRCLTNRLEIVSLILLGLLTTLNIFWGHQDPCVRFPYMKEVRSLVVYAEYIILLWPLILMAIVVLLAIILGLFRIKSEGKKETTKGQHHWQYTDNKNGREKMLESVGDSKV